MAPHFAKWVDECVGGVEKNSLYEMSVEVRLLAQTGGIGGVVLYNCEKVWMTGQGATGWAARRS